MKTKRFRISVLLAAIFLATGLVAEAQVGKLMQRAKKAVTEKTNMSADNVSGRTIAAKGNALYVSMERGSARAEGTKDAPMRDIQKAVDKAADGDIIRVAQGNYLGNLDRGWIQIKGKYVSLEGGWNDDFTERNPIKYITRIQPSVEQRGTIGQGLLMIEATANKNAQMIIDGLFFDLGLVHEYAKADPTDARFGCPEGCETGRIMPVGNPPNKTIRLIGGKMAGKLAAGSL